MSKFVFERLKMLVFYNKLPEGMPTHEERVEIDKEIERETKMDCDTGVKQLTDQQLKEIVERVKRKKKPPMELYA